MGLKTWWTEFTKPDPKMEHQIAQLHNHKAASYLMSAYSHLKRAGMAKRNFIYSDWTQKNQTEGFYRVSLNFIGRVMVEGDL